MAVLIKGMEMPQNCDECPLNSTCGYSLHMPLYHIEKRHDDCPLIEVPEPHDLEVPEPHGWLILADELIEFIENRYDITWKDDYEGGIKDACVDILEKISTMPRYSTSESKERPVFLPQYELTPRSEEAE